MPVGATTRRCRKPRYSPPLAPAKPPRVLPGVLIFTILGLKAGCIVSVFRCCFCGDRMVDEAYGRAYCAMVPDARFELIERAGHFPHQEQPIAFAKRVLAFMDEKQ